MEKSDSCAGGHSFRKLFDNSDLSPKLSPNDKYNVVKQLVPPTLLKKPEIWWSSHKAKFMLDLGTADLWFLTSNSNSDILIQFLQSQLFTPDEVLMEFCGEVLLQVDGQQIKYNTKKILGQPKYLKELLLGRLRAEPLTVRLRCSVAFEGGIPEEVPDVVTSIYLVEKITDGYGLNGGNARDTANARTETCEQSTRQTTETMAYSGNMFKSWVNGATSTILHRVAIPGTPNTSVNQSNTPSPRGKSMEGNRVGRKKHSRLLNAVLHQRSRIKKGVTMKKVLEIIKRDYEVTGGLKYFRLSVICQLTMTRIIIPARYRTCPHVQCFDLEAYIQMVQNSDKLFFNKCPICQREVTSNDLAIDCLLDRVLRSRDRNGRLDRECEFVRIYDNGAWEWESKRVRTDDADKDKVISVIDLDDD